MSNDPKTPQEVAAQDPRNTAVDIDMSQSGGRTGHGSGFHLGDGVVITASHVGENVAGNAKDFSSMSLRMARSPYTQDRTDSIGRTDFTDIGNYAGDPFDPTQAVTASNHDIAAIQSDLRSDINSSLIVFENPNNASGTVETLGFPSQSGSRTLNGTTPYYSSGQLSQNSMSTRFQYNTLVSDKDHPTDPAITGMDAIGGQSGGQVQLDYSLSSEDSRLGTSDLNDNVVGVAVHGSRDSSGISHTSSQRGVGIEEFDQQTYNQIGNIARDAALENSADERYEAGKDARRDEVRADGGRWNRDAKDAFRDEIENDPISDQQIADRFADNVMVANQSVTNEDAARADTAGTPLASTFNGSHFNETMYTNQNVNMNIDMGAGTDTADYYVLSSNIDVTVRAENISVQKSYLVTSERDVLNEAGETVLNDDGTNKTETVTETHNATDTVTNAETIIGTGSDDTFTINDLSGVDKLDGRDLPPKADGTAHAENDTLSLGPDMGPVSWTFDRNTDGSINRESGTVSDGTSTVRFENMETVQTRDGDTVDGELQGAGQAVPGQRTEISIPDAARTFGQDLPIVRAELEMKAETETLTERETVVADVIETPFAPVMLNALKEGGVDSLDVTGKPMDTAFNRVDTLLTSGADRFSAENLPTPHAEMNAAYAANEQEQQQFAEADNSRTYEEDHSYSLA